MMEIYGMFLAVQDGGRRRARPHGSREDWIFVLLDCQNILEQVIAGGVACLVLVVK